MVKRFCPGWTWFIPLFLLLIHPGISASQPQSDHCGINEANQGPGTGPDIACFPDQSAQTNVFFHNMRLLAQHVPGHACSPTKAVKTIRIKVFVWSDPNNPTGQFAPSEANKQAILQTMQRIEHNHWSNNLPPTDPTPYYQQLIGNESCADPNSNWYQCNPETRLRLDFDLDDIHFFPDADMYNKNFGDEDREDLNNQAHSLVEESRCALLIHIVGPNCLTPGSQGAAGAAHLPRYEQVGLTWVTSDGVTTCSRSDPGTLAFDAQDVDDHAIHWAHELGHTMQLRHLYPGGAVATEPTNKFDRDFLSDIFGLSAPAGTDVIPQSWTGLPAGNNAVMLGDGEEDPALNPWDQWTNVLMGANRFGLGPAQTATRFVSPLQMARMHRALMLTSTSRYAWGFDPEPYEVPSVFSLFPSVNFDFPIPMVQDFRMKMYQDLHIPRGAILTVKCTLEFVPQARLVIEPGGKLIIDGGLIRAAEFSPAQWRGIEVRGDAMFEVNGTAGNWFDPHNGVLEIVNGGRIENAEVGVYLGDRDRPEQGGGIVKTGYGTPSQGFPPTAPIIRNCNIGVEFPAGPRSGVSVLDHILFERNTDALPGSTGNVLEAHIKLTDMPLQTITACSFTNTVPGLPSLERGQGILGVNSGVIVWPGCPYGSQPNTTCSNNGEPNVFLGMDHGIDLSSTGPQSVSVIYKNVFENNIISVYGSGTNNIMVHDNHIKMGATGVEHTGEVDMAFSGYERGIYFTESYAFSIRDNTVEGLPGSKAEAIVVGYSRDWNETVMANEVHDIHHAYVGEGICADVYNGGHNFIGLNFTCNTNENNRVDFWSRKVMLNTTPFEQGTHTIRGNQGSLSSAADNTFDHVTDFGHSDFHVETEFTNISYFQRVLTGPEAYDPQVYDENRMQVYVLTGTNYSACNNSPVGPVPPVTGVYTDLNDRRLAYANTRYLYNSLIDGGNTDEVVQEVMSAWPNEAWELRSYLLEKSPYLSIDALKAAVEKESFPMAMKAEVCIANPEATKQEGFIKWLEYEAVEPMPEYLRDAIRASWDTKTYRMDLEVALADHHTAMTEAAETLVAHYYLEPNVNTDNVRWVWQQIRNPAARYAEANTHLAENSYDEAIAVVQSIPLDQELKNAQVLEQQRMISYLNTLKSANQQGRDKWHLNTGEVAQLQAHLGDAYDRSATWISNLLCAGYGICRAPLTGGDEAAPKAFRRPAAATTELVGSDFRTAPNPAETWVAFTYTFQTEPTDAFVVVRDAMGKNVAQLQMPNKQGQLVLDTRALGSGLYTVQYTVAGKTVQTDKLVIQ